MEYLLTVKGFRDALREGKFLGLKCNDCGGITVPPKKVCADCTSEDMTITELSRDGKVRTGTIIYVAPEGYPRPLSVVIVELAEGPWITASLVGWDMSDGNIMDIIGGEGTIGYLDVPAHDFSAGEQLAVTFTLK